jgi:YD repeat-containing protein
MHRHAVNSSVIRTLTYDEQHNILEVEFRTGRTYQYSAVSPAKYQELRGADSIGEFFNRQIRTAHPYVEVTKKRRP